MRFFISRPDNLMAIDNVAISMDCSSLASTVKYVIWNENGSGFLEPSSGIALRTAFTDPSPYQSLINAWITTQSTATTAITLVQAQAVKCELINAIYVAKRQAPVSVAVTAGTYSWDATDDTVTRVIAPLSGLLYVDPLNNVIRGGGGETGGGLATMVSNLDTWATNFGTLQTNVQTAFNALVSELHTVSSNAASYDTLNSTTTDAGLQTYLSSLANVTLSTVSDTALGEAFTAVTTPTIKLIPIGQSTPVSLSPTDLQAIVVAINNQNANEQSVSLSKQAAVNALTTISAVTSYDATTGW